MKVLIADDHGLFREGCKLLLNELEPQMRVVEASDFNDVQDILGRENDFDIILLDLKMPGMGEIEGVKRTRDLAPATPLVVVSALDDPFYAQQVMSSGAAGYIPKSASHSVMSNALKLILAGGHYVPPDLMSRPGLKPEEDDGPLPTGKLRSEVEKVLTRRQLDVMRYMAKGESNRRIAQHLGLSEGTVKVHVAAILKALNAANRTQAVLMASSGLVNDL